MCDWDWQHYVVATWLMTFGVVGPAMRWARDGSNVTTVGDMIARPLFACAMAYALSTGGFFR